MRLLLILIPSLLSAQQMFQQTPAINYYVDSVNGSDSNPPGLPYATVSHLTTIDAATPRQVWNLHKDSVFYTPVTTPRTNMTVQQFGTGTNYPLIDGGYGIPAASWAVSSGPCYVATVSVNLAAAKTWVNVWANNSAIANYVTSAANCASTANSYYASAHLGSGLTSISLYVNLNGVNPGAQADGYIAVSYLQWGLSTGSAAQYAANIYGIWTRRQTGENGSALFGPGSFVNGLLASDGSKHNVLSGGNVILYNVEAHNAYEYSTTNGMIQGSGTSGTIYCNGCTALQDSYVSTSNGFDQDAPSSGGGWTSCTWINSTSSGQGQGWSGANCASITYSGDTSANNSVGYTFGVLNTSGSMTNSSHACYAGANGRGVQISSASSPTITLSGLTISNDGGTEYGVYNVEPNVTLSVTNSSVFLNVANSDDLYFTTAATGNSITSTNNYFKSNSYIYFLQPTLSAFTSNNNGFYMPLSRTAAFKYNNTDYGLSAYQTASSQDGSSTPIATSIVYDFGSYSSGATPATVTDSGNTGFYPLTRNAFTFNGVAAAFSGTAQNGTQSQSTLTNASTIWAIFNPSVVSCGSLCIVIGQVNEFEMGISSSKQVYFYNANGVTLTNSTSLTASNWYFIAATCDPVNGGNLYIGRSGTLTNVGSSATACSGTNSYPNSITIGSQSNSASYLTGQIAQAGMYNTTQTPTQLQALLNTWTTINSGRGITIQ